MRRFAALIICLTIVLSGCVSTGSVHNTDVGSGDASTAGTVADPQSNAGEENNANNGSTVKPALEIIGEEEEDIDRAVANRTSKSAVSPDAHFLYPVSSAAGTGNRKTDADAAGYQEAGNKAAHKEYTIMVYIVGSNLESHHGAATEDIAEMKEAGIDYGKTNLLLYTGGSKRWISNVPNDMNCVLDMSKEDEARTIATTRTSADMGAPETLAEFINFCTTYYPADHYGLILWDHGGGPLWGYGTDELFGNDSLLLDEMRTAMNNTQFSNEKNLDWVGFDACLMGSIENAVLWKEYAEYLISSEEIEAGKGWDYHFLNVLNESQDTKEIVKSIVDSYGNYYENHKSEFFSPDATLSAIDLSRTDELIESVDALFDVMNEDIIGAGAYASINQARSRTKALGLAAVSGAEEGYDLVDLQDFAVQLEEIYPKECAAVKDAVKKAVFYETTNVEDAGGISIYVPGNNKALFNVSGELTEEGEPLSTQYKSFVDSYTGEWFEESDIDWHLSEIQVGDGELTLQLTPEQAANMSEASYTVLQRELQYNVPILTSIIIQPDENGLLHIPADPMLATVTSGTSESRIPWACYLVDSKNGVNTYGTWNTWIMAEGDFYDFDPVLDEKVGIIFKNAEGERETTIKDVMSVSGGISSNGKGSIDMLNYTTVIDMGQFGYMEKRNKNGEILPFQEWEDEKWSYESTPVTVDEDFQFVMMPSSYFDYNYACQVIIKDIHDGLHATECQPFPSYDERETIEKKTENGVITLVVFEDHVEVKSYKGTDSEVEIPEKVNGKPVTVIEKDAFENEDKAIERVILPDTIVEIESYAMMNLKDIVLPEGLRSIGNYAFLGYSSEEIFIPDSVEYIGLSAFENSLLTRVKLPASLKKVSAMPFRNCYKLKEITISDSNQNYTSIDGVLYTKDGKTLIEYPHGKGASFTIANGTETIAYGAFAEDKYETTVPLEHISFPDSLRVIENAAFHECIHLQELELPDSVESIGDLAFGYCYASTNTLEECANVGIIHLGPNVIRIGKKAFSALKAEGFEVNSDNERFASKNGFLTDKSEDMILEAPMNPGMSLIIPEGITTLPDKVFYDMKEEKHFYIPDTVFRFSDMAFDYLYEDEYEYDDLPEFTFHCTEGSAAESYAKKYHIPCITGPDWESVLGTVTDEEEPFHEETENRNEITLTWHLYDDHAVLARIETEVDKEVSEDHQYIEIETYDCEIPALYKNLPVTALGAPDEDIFAITYAYIDHLIIPDSVNEIRPEFLDGLTIVENIEVSEDNTAYMSLDNVLFTADGKTLIYYPRYIEKEEYTIPEGTEIIGEKAFYDCMYLKKVIFADSVSKICDNAFSLCLELKTVHFNEGLKIIEDYVFSDSALHDVKIPSTVERIGDSAFKVDDKFGEIILPESLTYLGWSAFNNSNYRELFMQDTLRIPDGFELSPNSFEGVIFDNYEVGEKNPYHTVLDGLLLSKDGKTLISVPGQRKGVFKIPEGIEVISYSGAFKDSRFLTDVYLPHSVISVGDLGKDIDFSPCPYTIHCFKGSVAQEQFDYYGIDWVEIEP